MENSKLSKLEERFQVERTKFDTISSQIRLDDTDVLPPHADFMEYTKTDSYLLGVGELLGNLNGKKVIEIGCGTGLLSVLLAKSGATVAAFDISPGSISVARKRAELNNVGDNIDFKVAVAEDLPFEDETFDVAFGLAILHHLDVELASVELHRILKIGGIAVFSEPLANNRAIRFIRDHVPYSRKAPRGTDHPLTYDDIRAWGQLFDECHWQEMHLLGMLERILGWRWQFPRIHQADRLLLDKFTFLRPYANYAVISFKKLHNNRNGHSRANH